jgi:hypothetical protein
MGIDKEPATFKIAATPGKLLPVRRRQNTNTDADVGW